MSHKKEAMSEKKKRELKDHPQIRGMSLRDYFAAMALYHVHGK